MFPGSLFIFFPSPPRFPSLGFWFRFTRGSRLMTPITTLLHLVWFPPTPPPPLFSVHPRVYPLITDLPSSLQSSSVPHRDQWGEWVTGVYSRVGCQKWMNQSKCSNRRPELKTTKGTALNNKRPLIQLSANWWVDALICFTIGVCTLCCAAQLID